MWWMNQLDFGNWLIAEAEKRGIYLNDVATAGGMDKSTIFRIAKGTRTAGIDSILAIASALKLPKETVFREAGILSSVPEQTMICGLPTPKPRPWTIGFSSNVNVLLKLPNFA